ncbi:hypothetical protein DPMN_000630 [Dreissena polymorpha]|uniref:Uncharacterized protein n=1 Tax=Dreissena polymorpha TaxID=45954 RepID=A0A9D4RS73_DREPO|nr:hypothetical protein DPMN_000630 [Dreissena polymorpha]
MAPLAVTGRRLHPRDGFPSALSALGTTAPGSLFKATPSMFLGPPQRRSTGGGVSDPGPSRMSPTLVVSLSRRPRPSSDGTYGRSGPANSRR